MILVTTDFISGKELQTLSLARGSTVHSKNIGRDLLSSFKTLVGGEITDYTEMMEEARVIATQRMTAQAEQLGADARNRRPLRFFGYYAGSCRDYRLRDSGSFYCRITKERVIFSC